MYKPNIIKSPDININVQCNNSANNTNSTQLCSKYNNQSLHHTTPHRKGFQSIPCPECKKTSTHSDNLSTHHTTQHINQSQSFNEILENK